MTDSDTIEGELKAIESDIAEKSGAYFNVLRSENDRLRAKQTNIIDAKFGQNRIIDLNQSQMKRTAAYTKVGVLTVVSLGIILMFRMLGSSIPIPGSILSIIYVLLISVCVFYGIYTYTDVNGRDATNFDRYNIPPPVITISKDEKDKKLAAAKAAGDILGAGGQTLCSGQGCCELDQAYNSILNKCAQCPSDAPVYDTTKNSCGTCATSATSGFLSATRTCGTCATSSTSGYSVESKSCETCSGTKSVYDSVNFKCKSPAG